MSLISDQLKHNESFIDVPLKEIVNRLIESTRKKPVPELMFSMHKLTVEAIRMETLVDQLCLNATEALSRSTSDFIISDNKIVDAISNDPAYFDDPARLTKALALVESARKAATNFTEHTYKRFNEMKEFIILNEADIKMKLDTLITKLSEPASINVVATRYMARMLTEQIREENTRIERNIQSQKTKFGYDIDDMAYLVEWTLKKLSDAFYNLLPDSVIRSFLFFNHWWKLIWTCQFIPQLNLSLEPKCDSPEHLKKRMYKMTDDLSDALFVADLVPSEIVGNLKSSCLWASGQLQDSLSYLLFTAVRYNRWTDDVVCNASTRIERATNQKITTDFNLIKIVDDHPECFASPDNLNAACDVCEAARNLTAHYKFEASQLVDKLVFKLVPNVDHLNELLITLSRQLRLSDDDDVAKGKEELLKMTHELQEANRFIENNISAQLNVFEESMNKTALTVNDKLKNLADKLQVLCQLPVSDNGSDAAQPKLIMEPWIPFNFPAQTGK